MSLVSVHTEWDPLEEVIIGIADGARVPTQDCGLFAVDYADYHDDPGDVPTGAFEQWVIDEANEDLAAFRAVLDAQGVVVRRPEVVDHARPFGTPDWTADGQFAYCPRDVLLTVGDMVIEAPMVLRSRYFEPLAYREILLDYFTSGARWISAPKPRLLDESYNLRPPSGAVLNNLEPIFDAANVLRVGRDILFLVSTGGNMLGLRWLQSVLGDDYRVHPVAGLYEGTHVDTTIALVRPGLVVLNPERIPRDQVPSIFKSWDIIWCPEMLDTGYLGSHPRSSIWQGMNFIMINPGLAIINELQLPLIKLLEQQGVDVVPLKMRHARTLAGGFHCTSLDTRRTGSLEDYT